MANERILFMKFRKFSETALSEKALSETALSEKALSETLLSEKVLSETMLSETVLKGNFCSDIMNARKRIPDNLSGWYRALQTIWVDGSGH